jgi:hypothetical protein
MCLFDEDLVDLHSSIVCHGLLKQVKTTRLRVSCDHTMVAHQADMKPKLTPSLDDDVDLVSTQQPRLPLLSSCQSSRAVNGEEERRRARKGRALSLCSHERTCDSRAFCYMQRKINTLCSIAETSFTLLICLYISSLQSIRGANYLSFI